MVVSALTATLLMTAAPASAAPALTEASCAADGGAYVAAKGTRTCTVRGYVLGEERNLSAQRAWFEGTGFAGVGGTLTGVWTEYTRTRVDTVRTLQKGKLTTTTTETVELKAVVPTNCYFSPYIYPVNSGRALTVCLDAGLYPASIGI